MGATSIRWGRVVLGGFLAELVLVVLVIPIRALGGPESAVTVVAVAGSFFVFVPVAWWLFRYVAHVLKVAGGAAGGWFALRRAVA